MIRILFFVLILNFAPRALACGCSHNNEPTIEKILSHKDYVFIAKTELNKDGIVFLDIEKQFKGELVSRLEVRPQDVCGGSDISFKPDVPYLIGFQDVSLFGSTMLQSVCLFAKEVTDPKVKDVFQALENRR